MEILLFENTGLDKNYHNVIAHADFSAWVNARRGLSTTAVFTVPKRTFFDGDTLDLSPIKNYSLYDYAVAVDGNNITGLFIEPVFADSTIVRYSVTLDRWSALPEARFVDFTIEQSTVSSQTMGGVPADFIDSGSYEVATPTDGKCWSIAFVSDAGNFTRSGTHSFIAVGPLDSVYDAYTTAVEIARCTSVTVGGKQYSIDSVSGAYVVPASILPAAGAWGDRVVTASITGDTPGALAYSGYFYETSYSATLTSPPSGVEYTASLVIPRSNYDKKYFFGNFAQLVELPERSIFSVKCSTVITPSGTLSVRATVAGELYDFSDSFRVDAYSTGEDATTRAITAGAQLVSSVGSVGLSAASGNPVAITGSAISAGGSIARTLSEGRAYAYHGGGFRAACTVTVASDGNVHPVLMPGLFIVAHRAANAADRLKFLTRYGRIYQRILNGNIELDAGEHFTYYRGSGTTFPAAGWLADALRNGMTLWDAAGVNQV